MRSLEALNGFLTIGYRSSAVAVQVQKIESLDGSLFPLSVGNKFSLTYVLRDVPVSTTGDRRVRLDCSVTRKRPASDYLKTLLGDAFVIQCTNNTSLVKPDPKDSLFPFSIEVTDVFFSSLGYFLQVDTPNTPSKNDIEGRLKLTDFKLAR
jgi:hypothetical protein